MKYPTKIIFLSFIISGLFCSCKKNEDKLQNASSLTIVNCLTDNTTIFSKLYDSQNVSFAKKDNGIAPPFGAFLQDAFFIEKGLAAGNTPLKIYAFPDSIKPIISTAKQLAPGGIYSFFVYGNRLLVDTLFVKDNVPSAPMADSTVFVRIVNLTKNASPLKVALLGESATIPGFSALVAKSVTSFEKVSVKKDLMRGNVLKFEVVDTSSGVQLTTFDYQWNNPLGQGGDHFLSQPVTILLLNVGSAVRPLVIRPKTKF